VAGESTAAKAAGVRVSAADPQQWPTVLGSETDLTRVVRNLLVNAVRHTPPGGVVELSAGVRDGSAWLRVQDGCGGIPEQDLPRVFDAGFRGSAARTPGADAGAGLGLAIALALAQAQQGSLAVINHGAGCRFELTLPAAPARVAAPR